MLDFWSIATPRGARNRAIVRLMCWEGLQPKQTLSLEMADWVRERSRLVLPPRKGAPRTREGVKRKVVVLSPGSREMLDAWSAMRASLGAGPLAPLFCQIEKNRTNFAITDASFRQTLRYCAKEIGLSKRLSSEVLRASGVAHRKLTPVGPIEGEALGYLHEDVFQLRHPDAFAHWQRAGELMREGPTQNATVIGHECREALLIFASDLARDVLAAEPSRGPIDRLRAVIAAIGPHSETIAAHLAALLSYWGTTLDLTHRQEHGAVKERASLGPEDGRRVVFHTMIVMYEWDRFVTVRHSSGSPS